MGPLRCLHALLEAFILSCVPDVRPEQHGTSPSAKKLCAVTREWMWNVPGSDPQHLRGHEGDGDLHCPST